MCAGQFDVIENEDANSAVEMKIYIRNSKRNQVDAHELFRVVNIGIKFYEEFTSTKYPWEKYD